MMAEAGVVGHLTAVILIVCFLIYIVGLVISARKHPTEETKEEVLPLWKCLLLIAAGLVLVVIGGKAVVYGAGV